MISNNDGYHYHHLAKVPKYDHETSREHDETNAHDLCSKHRRQYSRPSKLGIADR